MTGLKEKLTLDQNRDIEIQFREIAQALFQNYHVEKKVKINEKEENIRYDFLEIEFYYFSKDHQDFTTYPRETEAGNWFFHASGVDIAFKSEKTDCAIPKSKTRNRKMITSGSFGGILIRSLLKTMGGEKPQMIAGPYKCVDELFDTFDAFGIDPSYFPTLKWNEAKNEAIVIESCPRWIPPYTDKNVNKEKIERKRKELLERYSSEKFEKENFEKFIGKTYRYYRVDLDWTEVKNYPAKP